MLINSVRTSCGCTVAKLPEQPWHIAPGGSGPIEVSMDLRGRRGVQSKSVTVESSSGIKSLVVKANIAEVNATTTPEDGKRVNNLQAALADRQAVFKGDCASCHVEPAKGKMGAELYTAACAICHDAEHRAAMVPDLKVRHPGTAYDWKTWIMYGRPGSLMPGFAKSEGGPLTDEQIASLSDLLWQKYGSPTTGTVPGIKPVSPAFSVPPATPPTPPSAPVIVPRAAVVAPPSPAVSTVATAPTLIRPAPPAVATANPVPPAAPKVAVPAVKPAAPASSISVFPFPKDK